MEDYDAIIVGGRCAGAATATWLARSGSRVLVLEAGRLGTDMVLSTHTVHPSGMDLLDELGVGDAVRRESPPARQMRIDIDGAHADFRPPDGRSECCPRRFRLDRLLQDAAIGAGAEVCYQARVQDLIRDGDRIVGVVAESQGRTTEIRGRMTIGADGRHSTVAKLAEAEEYLAYEWPRGMYWAYWRPPATWHSDAYPYDFLFRSAGNDRRVIFSTDGGELLLGTLPLVGEARAWRSHAEERYLADLRSDPVFAPLCDGGEMTSPVIGTVSERFFFRRAAGPGWALVGDAGHFKDPIVGWGISEALHQAKTLANAIAEGTDTALERYWRSRDVETLPRYRTAEDRSSPGPFNPVFPLVIGKVASRPELAGRMMREFEFGVNPYEVLPVASVARWVLGAAIRGRPGLLRHFLAQGRRAMSVQREVAAARKALEALPA